jgi:hypothetical protein
MRIVLVRVSFWSGAEMGLVGVGDLLMVWVGGWGMVLTFM